MIPTVTASPQRGVRAYLAEQGSRNDSGVHMVCVEMIHESSKSVFMVPLELANNLRDQITNALELAKEIETAVSL